MMMVLGDNIHWRAHVSVGPSLSPGGGEAHLATGNIPVPAITSILPSRILPYYQTFLHCSSLSHCHYQHPPLWHITILSPELHCTSLSHGCYHPPWDLALTYEH